MADDALTPEIEGPDDHLHGPYPSFEWVLEGGRDIVLPHLKSMAPLLKWKEEHFHVTSNKPEDEDLPELFQIELGGEPVGGIDFLPLPAKRTLMRLYVCSDLGTSCRIDDGNNIIQGFATAWLQRLQRLGFLSSRVAEQQMRTPLGFKTPATVAGRQPPRIAPQKQIEG